MRIPSLVLGEYSDLRSQDFNYGNDGCDGFAPNFPLIRAGRNQTAKFIQLRHNSSLCEDRYTTKVSFCQWILKMKPFHYAIRHYHAEVRRDFCLPWGKRVEVTYRHIIYAADLCA